MYRYYQRLLVYFTSIGASPLLNRSGGLYVAWLIAEHAVSGYAHDIDKLKEQVNGPSDDGGGGGADRNHDNDGEENDENNDTIFYKHTKRTMIYGTKSTSKSRTWFSNGLHVLIQLLHIYDSYKTRTSSSSSLLPSSSSPSTSTSSTTSTIRFVTPTLLTALAHLIGKTSHWIAREGTPICATQCALPRFLLDDDSLRPFVFQSSVVNVRRHSSCVTLRFPITSIDSEALITAFMLAGHIPPLNKPFVSSTSSSSSSSSSFFYNDTSSPSIKPQHPSSQKDSTASSLLSSYCHPDIMSSSSSSFSSPFSSSSLPSSSPSPLPSSSTSPSFSSTSTFLAGKSPRKLDIRTRLRLERDKKAGMRKLKNNSPPPDFAKPSTKTSIGLPSVQFISTSGPAPVTVELAVPTNGNLLQKKNKNKKKKKNKMKTIENEDKEVAKPIDGDDHQKKQQQQQQQRHQKLEEKRKKKNEILQKEKQQKQEAEERRREKAERLEQERVEQQKNKKRQEERLLQEKQQQEEEEKKKQKEEQERKKREAAKKKREERQRQEEEDVRKRQEKLDEEKKKKKEKDKDEEKEKEKEKYRLQVAADGGNKEKKKKDNRPRQHQTEEKGGDQKRKGEKPPKQNHHREDHSLSSNTFKKKFRRGRRRKRPLVDICSSSSSSSSSSTLFIHVQPIVSPISATSSPTSVLPVDVTRDDHEKISSRLVHTDSKKEEKLEPGVPNVLLSSSLSASSSSSPMSFTPDFLLRSSSSLSFSPSFSNVLSVLPLPSSSSLSSSSLPLSSPCNIFQPAPTPFLKTTSPPPPPPPPPFSIPHESTSPFINRSIFPFPHLSASSSATSSFASPQTPPSSSFPYTPISLLPPPPPPLFLPTSSLYSRLHEDIVYRATKSDLERRARVPDRQLAHKIVVECVSRLWPHAYVELYGSVATGLDIAASDIDLSITNVHGDRQSCAHLTSYLLLHESHFVIDVHPRVRAAVPVVRLVVLVHYGRTQHVDVTFGDSILPPPPPPSSPLRPTIHQPFPSLEKKEEITSTTTSTTTLKTAWIQQCMLKRPLLLPLMMMLKPLLRDHNMHKPYKGGLGSYCLTLLLLVYLESVPGIVDLGVLLLGFLDYYSQFDSTTHGISISSDFRFSSSSSSSSSSSAKGLIVAHVFSLDPSVYPCPSRCLVVHDPFAHLDSSSSYLSSHFNVARSTTTFPIIQTMFRQTRDTLSTSSTHSLSRYF